VPVASTLRVIVNVLLDAAVISTISSMAVSGSITTVNVAPLTNSPEPTVASNVLADDTAIEVAPDVIADVSVVC
jgi:ABC-type Na+ efflux pump permease subunit